VPLAWPSRVFYALLGAFLLVEPPDPKEVVNIEELAISNMYELNHNLDLKQ